MTTYHKIHGTYKRDDDGAFILGDYADDAFEYLAANIWVWTEKVDGTNIRLSYDGDEVSIGGRTDRAQIPAPLVAALRDVIEAGGEDWAEKFPFATPEAPTTVYGEGYGAGIQKGGGNYRDGVGFIPFDVAVRTEAGHTWWLDRENVAEVAQALSMEPAVPVIGVNDLAWAEDFVAAGFDSQVAERHGKTHTAEGLVGVPEVPLFNRRGQRIIAKVKVKDYTPR